jgi:hypothetical protein
MKKAVIITIIVLSCIKINAQTITGVVCDDVTKQPIPGVYVYFDGTSIGDVTDNSGKFTLTLKQMINTNLVFRHLLYGMLVFEDGLFLHLPDTIYMKELPPNILGDVVVRADNFSRRQRLRAFREQFLGMSQAGRSCRIMNEDDIQIWFNVATKTLSASSDKPIEVINEYLGYRVFFLFFYFWTEYSEVTLDPAKAERTYRSVTASFTDLRPDDVRTKERRDEFYERSSVNFFKTLAYNPYFNTLQNPIFRIYKDGSPIDFRSYFTVKDTLSLKMILIPDAVIERRNPDKSLLRISVLHRETPEFAKYYSDMYYFHEGGPPNNSNILQPNSNTRGSVTAHNFANSITDLHRNTLQNNERLNYHSHISFFTNTLLVDQYGNIDQSDKVFFSGVMGWARAGDMLPKDYVP